MSSKKMTTTASASAKCFCNVCFDAGKTESEYTSHYVRASRDAGAKVVCPTLLALECKYCFHTGHTVKYCGVLKNQAKVKKIQERESKQVVLVAAETKKKESKNTFQALCDSSDEEEEDKDKEDKDKKKIQQKETREQQNKNQSKEAFPALPSRSIQTNQFKPLAMSYSSIIQNGNRVTTTNTILTEENEPVIPARNVQVAAVSSYSFKHLILDNKSWADICDSSSDDDQKEEDNHYEEEGNHYEEDDFDDESW